MEDAVVENFTVQIIVDGITKSVIFPLVPDITIDIVQNKMRSTFGVINGTLSCRVDRIVIVRTFVAGRVYFFINFSIAQGTITNEYISDIVDVALKKRKLAEPLKGPSTRSAWIQSLPQAQFKVVKNLVSFSSQPNRTQCRQMQIPSDAYINQLSNLPKEPSDVSIMGTRSVFEAFVSKWTLPTEQIETAKRSTPTVGIHKPDILHRQKQSGTGEQSIRLIGVLKGMYEGEFRREDQGQICEFLQTLLTVQPWRTFAYGYVTDCVRFEFYRALKSTRNEQPCISFERSGILSGSSGWEALRSLCCQSDDTLGYEAYSIPGWELQSWLGSGATSAVFMVTSTTARNLKAAVCKVYLKHTVGSTLRHREYTALQRLSHFECVAKVVDNTPAQTKGGVDILITTPIGSEIPTFIRPPIAVYAPIVQALQYAHTHRVYHNDIAPQNLLGIWKKEDESMAVILNDFGSASIDGETFPIATRSLFYEEFGAAADLKALVRSIFVVTQSTFDLNNVSQAVELDRLMYEQLFFWEQALLYASQTNYDRLFHHLARGGRPSQSLVPNFPTTLKAEKRY